MYRPEMGLCFIESGFPRMIGLMDEMLVEDALAEGAPVEWDHR